MVRLVAEDGEGAVELLGEDSAGELVGEGEAGQRDGLVRGLEEREMNTVLASDDQGGALVSWGTGYGSSEKSYLQRIGSNGKLLWGTKGIKLGD